MTDLRHDGAAALEWAASYLERVRQPPVLAQVSQRLLERVNSSGQIFISHAMLHGRYALRLAVGQLRTTQEDVEWAWEVLSREASQL